MKLNFSTRWTNWNLLRDSISKLIAHLLTPTSSAPKIAPSKDWQCYHFRRHRGIHNTAFAFPHFSRQSFKFNDINGSIFSVRETVDVNRSRFAICQDVAMWWRQCSQSNYRLHWTSISSIHHHWRSFQTGSCFSLRVFQILIFSLKLKFQLCDKFTTSPPDAFHISK